MFFIKQLILKPVILILQFLWMFTTGLNAYKPASGNYDFNQDVLRAYNLVIDLRFNEAYTLLNQIKKAEPYNLATLIVEDYIDFLALMISEDKTLFRKLEANKDIRFSKIDKYGPASDPYHLFIKAEINMHWAAIDFRFGNYISCATGAIKAYKQLVRNNEKFPGFTPNMKNLGLIHVLVGSIPTAFKSGFSFFTGIDASIDLGMRELNSVIKYAENKPFIFKEETRILHAFIQLHINNEPELAWELLNKEKIDFDSQPLLAFIYANAAHHCKKNDACINILENRTYPNKYFALPLSYLTLGRAKLNRLDKDANIPIEKFLREYKGVTYRKEASLLLFWYYSIYSNPAKRDQYYKSVITEGNTKSESDQAALQELKNHKTFMPALIKSRLLYDGGYSGRAMAELFKVKSQIKANTALDLEYRYRFARILQQMNDTEAALKAYQTVLTIGKNQPEYFACNAALQMALIYEKSNKFEFAKSYFNQCLLLNPVTYKNSLHGKAKAGLIRLNSR